MGILSRFFKRDKRGREFTDEDRHMSIATRALNNQLRDMEQELAYKRKLAQMRRTQEMIDDLSSVYDDENSPDDYDDSDDSDDGSVEDKLMGFMLKMAGQKINPSLPSSESTQPEISLSDDKLKEIIAQFTPAQLKFFKKLDKETQIAMIKSRFPALSDETINRGVMLIES